MPNKNKVKYALGATGVLLFISGVILTIVGSFLGVPIAVGIGLGLILLTVATGIGVRERNLADS